VDIPREAPSRKRRNLTIAAARTRDWRASRSRCEFARSAIHLQETSRKRLDRNPQRRAMLRGAAQAAFRNPLVLGRTLGEVALHPDLRVEAPLEEVGVAHVHRPGVSRDRARQASSPTCSHTGKAMDAGSTRSAKA
jgi:hypothetical protein